MEENIMLKDLDGNVETNEVSGKPNLNQKKHKRNIKDVCENFRQHYLQSTVFQLVVFIIFLVILSFVTFGTTSNSRYHMTKAISMMFLKQPFGRGIFFEEISSIQDIWMYLEEVAVPGLFPEGTSIDNDTILSKYVLDGNVLLGIPRLKQIRVRNDSCRVHDDFRTLVSACYNTYSESAENRRPFGLKTGTAWVYSSEDELHSTSYWGLLHSYSGGGSYEDLGVHSEDPFKQLLILRNSSWINLATRIVVLDFTLYNVNVNLFSVVKLVMELPAGGGVWPSNSIRTINLLRYVTTWDYFILVLELLFCCFTLYYLIVEIIEITSQGLSYFLFKWNWVDSIILVGSIICISFAIYRTTLMSKLLDHLLANPNIFPNFEKLGFWQIQCDASAAVLVFLSWIKVFKYLSFNETMIQLSTTLTKCAKDVGGFALMFFIIFLAYAQLGYLLFGPQLQNFSRMETSIFTLMRLILGDFDYDSLERANRIMGPIFFVTFVFFVFIILLNMFLAILSDTYTQVKAKMESSSHPNKLKLGTILKAITTKFHRLFRKRDKIEDECDVNLKHGSNKVDKDEFEQEKVQKVTLNAQTPELGNVRKKVDNDEVKGVSLEDFEKLSIRVDDLRHEMEQIQRAIITKMAAIALNMEKLNERFPPL